LSPQIPAQVTVMTRKAALALTAAAAAVALAAAIPTPALARGAEATASEPAQQSKRAGGWTRALSVELSARDLGLSAGASAQRHAKAALERKAGRLGLPGSLSGVRVARARHVPRGPSGGRELDLVRFQQTVRGTRVVWSQIDVTIAAGEVSTIAATVVPVTGKRLAGKRKVSRKRALGIARRAVQGPDQALTPLPVAYAGTPTTKRKAKRRTPRLAWVVETTPASEAGAEAPTPLCIVVDAKTGKVIARWPGMADRPDRGPQARGAEPGGADLPTPDGATARGEQVNPTQFMLDVHDGTNAAADRTEPFDGTTLYSRFRIAGDPHPGTNWPAFTDSAPYNEPCGQLPAPPPCVHYPPRDRPDDVVAAMDAVATNARNVAFTICARRDYCGEVGGLIGDSAPGFYAPWQVIGNGTGTSSRFFRSSLAVEIRAGSEMDGTCDDPPPVGCPGGPGDPDPSQPFNDVIAHEFGHIMDLVYAGDRAIDEDDQEAREVEEALADMFAYDYDREDSTAFEDADGGIARNWEDPGAESLGGQSYPAHMDDYVSSPPNGDEHFNSTILSHAYYLFEQVVGHDVAGNVLQYVPFSLSPKPTFQEVAQAFHDRARDLYGSIEVTGPARAAFAQVGLPPSIPD